MDANAIQVRHEYELQGLTPPVIAAFRRIICRHYRSRGRDLPWRRTMDPYCILVSEFMLQQTRVETVQGHYLRFIERFPDFSTLASATFPEVLREWKGLGYNRRARALLQTARQVVAEHGGVLPKEEVILRSFPGIGRTTAAAVRAFAFNQPVVFLETNIRTVFIYFFFPEQDEITDRDILPLVEATIPSYGYREWYNGLMDYGVELKKQVGNLNRRMHSYRAQPRFAGSDRQLRGRILSCLMEHLKQPEERIQELTGIPTDRLKFLLSAMEREGFLIYVEGGWVLTQ
jgi:A/G-specific adenine glycosylase